MVSSTTVKVTVPQKVSAFLNTPVETPKVVAPAVQKVREWTFDDLITKPEPVKPVKKVVRKTTNKTVARKTTARKVVRKAVVKEE